MASTRVNRPTATLAALGLLLAACGGEPSMTEYAGEVEALIATMNAGLDRLDAEVEGTQDLDEIKRYATERVQIRNDFLDGMRALEPPDDADDLHDAALAIMGRLTDAETVLAERVLSLETAEGIDVIWETPEGLAARAADSEAIALCVAAQDEFDQTEERAELESVPWIPQEMKEVVRVAFGCVAAER
jgi:hypothetical protein